MIQHLGDITKLNGATIEPVWCVTGGSPCQDLSIAGKRAGLAGARSGLFMEQIRVIKEMREHDKRLGRAGELIRPRYMVWENVCFAGETLVTCKSGYKRIDQIAVGDEVKTHTRRLLWKKIYLFFICYQLRKRKSTSQRNQPIGNGRWQRTIQQKRMG